VVRNTRHPLDAFTREASAAACIFACNGEGLLQGGFFTATGFCCQRHRAPDTTTVSSDLGILLLASGRHLPANTVTSRAARSVLEGAAHGVNSVKNGASRPDI